MDVREAIERRRAYRSLDPVDIAEELIDDLAECASLSASCFNKQSWRYVFIYEAETLEEMKGALAEGNAWATKASMIIAVFSRPEDDCVIRDRIYNWFDTGMATQNIILRATELGLVAHPIAGFSQTSTKRILGIPDEYQVLTLIIVGSKAEGISDLLSEKQSASEIERPERKPINEIAFRNHYGRE